MTSGPPTSGPPTSGPPPSGQSGVLDPRWAGAWQLESIVQRRSDGSTVRPFGEACPPGMFVITPSGHMCVGIASEPYIGYFGVTTLEAGATAEAGLSVTAPLGASLEWLRAPQRRAFRFIDDDTVVLSMPGDEPLELTWSRAAPS